MICVSFLPQIDLESVFALNPDVAPDEEIPQSPEAPPSNVPKTSKLPKVCSPPAVLSKINNQSLSSRTLSEIIHDSWSEVFAQRQLISPSQCFIHLVVESLGLGLICTADVCSCFKVKLLAFLKYFQIQYTNTDTLTLQFIQFIQYLFSCVHWELTTTIRSW